MIFDALSISKPGRIGQLLKNVAIPSGGCVLCAGPCTGGVCLPCAVSFSRPEATCPACALPMPARVTCGACLRHPPAFEATCAAFDYRFPLDRLVQRFKFAGDLAAGRWLGEALAAAVTGAGRPDLLVATPLTRAGLRRRGFNQAVELARVVAHAHGLPFEPRLVEKSRETPAQHGLTRDERRANLRAAFRVRRRLDGAQVAIVDDVMTTGATADTLARALREAGASRVGVWVVARTPRPGQ